MNHNWEKFGEEIRKTVQDAIENQNYDKLNQAITDTINQAVDAVSEGVKYAAGAARETARRETAKRETSRGQTARGETARRETSRGQTVRRETARRETSRGETVRMGRSQQPPAKTMIKIPSKAGAMVITVLGYVFGGFWFLVLLGSLAANAAFGMRMGMRILSDLIYALTGTLMITGLGAGIWGNRRLIRVKRCQKYIEALGNKVYCNISELAAGTGESGKRVIKDIEYMIRKGWLCEGHLDKEKTCLMITDQMYSEYCRLEQQKEAVQKETQAREAMRKKAEEDQRNSRKNLSPEIQAVVEKGDEYVKKIRACNDDIPGEEISEKIYRIEMLVDKIFDRVEQEPKCVSDIQKLMDYYLPTTVKLLEAYAEMDAQPVGGENIQSAKQEIEATLDTLNIAFEKLLDSLFMEKAWDVSSDISVLNTMLAQEGLKEDGLKR